VIPEIPSVPRWISEAVTPLGELPIREVLTNSVYYPACGFDGAPVKYLGGNFHSFIYVDYGVGRDQFSQNLDGFLGYRVAATRDVTENELTPQGWTPQFGSYAGNPRLRVDVISPPFGVWSIFERTEEYGPEHGPDRFSLLYIGGDGVATFGALYYGNRVAPSVVAVIQPGHGFGGNWTNFEDPNGIFARLVLGNPNGTPEYLLFGGWGDGKYYQQTCWPIYSKRVRVLHGRLLMWRRSGDPNDVGDRPVENCPTKK
jgi:hypothetical protein